RIARDQRRSPDVPRLAGRQRTVGGLRVSRRAARPPPPALLLDRLDLRSESLLRRELHWHVNRREHAQAALIHALPSKAVDQLEADLLLEVLAVRIVGAERIAQGGLGLARRLPLGLVDRAVLEHRLQN